MRYLMALVLAYLSPFVMGLVYAHKAPPKEEPFPSGHVYWDDRLCCPCKVERNKWKDSIYDVREHDEEVFKGEWSYRVVPVFLTVVEREWDKERPIEGYWLPLTYSEWFYRTHEEIKAGSR